MIAFRSPRSRRRRMLAAFSCEPGRNYFRTAARFAAGVMAIVCAGGVRRASASEPAKPSPVLEAMATELAREMKALAKQPAPPYFISYEIRDSAIAGVSSSFGQLVSAGTTHTRELDADVRVGSYKLDNTHPVNGGLSGLASGFGATMVPTDDDPVALRRLIWTETDACYKAAAEQLTRVKTKLEVNVAAEDKSADFSHEPAAKYFDSPVPFRINLDPWKQRIRSYTAPFAAYGRIYGAWASLTAERQIRWFVSSEGSQIQTSQTYYRLFVSAWTRADDGMVLPRYESYFSFTPEGLPSNAAVLQAVQRMIGDLAALRKAPVADPYTGPAILSGRASAVFFHEVFGHRVEGQRQKEEQEGQTFKKMLGKAVLPQTASVYSDPTLARLGNTQLVGAYRFDDEGVAAERVPIVQDGILKTFLMSRIPIEGFAESNGHGRSQPGLAPVARQSNLIVQFSHSESKGKLKQMLIDEIKAQRKPYGLYFDDIQGGFTLTGRTLPNAFNVLPVMVYRVYPDGRQELVRGVDLIGTPLVAFSKIQAADDDVEVFNGICGAESGNIPVSAVSPGLLLAQVETQKKAKSQARLPILPPPFEAKDSNPRQSRVEAPEFRRFRIGF